ncbi:hypothetical protein [Azospirillum aestuarii]|uniref:hypothetical protein n=1 Tax=Azospirillum aestuarii TaxID=2802052 RepID=UPI004054C3A0
MNRYAPFNFDLGELPHDPEEAFMEFDARLFEYVEANKDQQSWSVERRYISRLKAFADEHEINLPFSLKIPIEDDAFGEWYRWALDQIDYYKTRLTIRTHRGKTSGTVTILTLNDGFRVEIHNRLNQIRSYIESSPLDEKKKDAIYSKIAALQAEVDKSKTRLDAFLSVQLDITAAIGKGAESLEPVVKLLDSVKKIFSRAKDENEQAALEKPQERRLIEGPKRDQEVDDEIPF